MAAKTLTTILDIIKGYQYGLDVSCNSLITSFKAFLGCDVSCIQFCCKESILISRPTDIQEFAPWTWDSGDIMQFDNNEDININ